MKLSLLFVALGLTLFFVGLRFVDPAPPRRIVLATGMKGGAYQEFGERYRTALAKDGITVELRQTSGSGENLRLLGEKAADIAFVQTGVGNPAANPGLQSLASLGFEPLWIFYSGQPIERFANLRGKRLAVGDPQSGTYALVSRMLADNGMTDQSLNKPLGGQAAADALRQGTVDAAFFVASVNAPLIQTLLRDGNLHLLDLDRVAAYASRYPFLSGITLPEGVIDMHNNVPPGDTRLVSPVMTLLAREDFHPALATLLLRAATEIHGGKGVLEEAGQFPSAAFTEFPLSDDARHFLKHGPSFLSRNLPFWLAAAIERLSYLILPLLTLLIPLLRMAPPVYVWRVRRQIYRWYEKLTALEKELQASLAREPGSASDPEKIRKQLVRLSTEVARVKVPLSYMDELYRLRTHIRMVMKEDTLHGTGPGETPAAGAAA